MSAHLSRDNINTFWASLITEELVRHGVTFFCVAPGSRSTPLALAAADHPATTVQVHFDERALAYQALGYIAGSGQSAAVITTSGTAVANCFPAVIEASKKKLPLILLTGDRPPELRFTGANQTIDQVKIFGDYVRFFFDFPCPDESMDPRMVLTTIDQAVSRARGGLAGPVHLNCMFREPLTPDKTPFSRKSIAASLKTWNEGNAPLTTWRAADKVPGFHQIDELQGRLSTIKNGWIVVGKLKTAIERRSVIKLAELLNWPVFPDITSGLRTGTCHRLVLSYFDHFLLNPKFLANGIPDGILHLGGRMTSGRYADFLKRSRIAEYIMILNHPLRNDPSHCVTLRLESHISQLCVALARRLPQRPESSWLKNLQQANQTVHHQLTKFLSEQPIANEPSVARLISELVPRGHGLFLGSSLPVREMDFYASPKGAAIPIESNRGASGIDGTLATACGFARGLQKPVTVLTGDLAFLYDLNALTMLRESPYPLTIVLLNNNGGGIFSFLPVARHPRHFETLFGTPHGLTFGAAANLFGLEHIQIESPQDFARMYSVATTSPVSTLIEVITDRQENFKLQKSWNSRIQEILQTSSRKGSVWPEHLSK